MALRFLTPLAAGGLLSVGCGGIASGSSPDAPVKPVPVEEAPDDVPLRPSTPPPTRTNPPLPSLLVDAEGQCHPFSRPARGVQPEGRVDVGPTPAFWGPSCATPERPADGHTVVDCGVSTRCSEEVLAAVARCHGVTFPEPPKPKVERPINRNPPPPGLRDSLKPR
jgi:hypothetical protein